MNRSSAFHEAIRADAQLRASISSHEWIGDDKPSYQLKALFYRAYSIQKRQMFTNIFCIGLCPFLIVFISAFLGSISNKQYNHILNSDHVLSCSKTEVVDEYGWPLSAKKDLPVSFTKAGVIRHFNMFKVQDNFKLSPLSKDQFEYCEFWASHNSNSSWDSTFLPQPTTPWLNVLYEPSNPNRDHIVKEFAKNQLRSFMIYGANSDLLRNITEIPVFPVFNSSLEMQKDFVNSSYSYSNSILGQIKPKYWVNFSSAPDYQFQKMPIFKKLPGNAAPKDIDAYLADKISDALVSFSRLPFSERILYQHVPSDADLIKFYGLAQDTVQDLPHGALWFDILDHENINYKYTLQIGQEKRLPFFPNPGKRQITQQAQLGQSILRLSNPDKLGNYSIVQGVRAFPHYVNADSFKYPIAEFTARLLFPLGLSCLIPVFVVILVKEKESKSVIMMRMNGVKLSMYLLVHYCVFLVLYWLSATSFLVFGYFSGMEFFENTSLSVLITILSIWGHLLICLSLFISVFFSRSRRALVFVFLMILCSILMHVVLMRYSPDTLPESIYYSWPPLTFYKSLDIINVASYSPFKKPYAYSDLVAGNELFTYLIIMYIQNTILFALAGYLSYVMPSEFGVRRPWYYALYRVCRQCTGIKKKRVVEGLESIDETELAELSKASDDLLVKKERHDVMCTKRYETAPLIIKNITKIYHRSNFSLSNCAIDGVTFAIEEGTVFGLLGCNGAGKSSLLGILTGLFESTSGTAFVAGYEVSKETKHVYRNIGICPQFNILWDQITVREHLLFYARIKGFRGSEENAVIRECMEQVELLDEEDILAKNLSCGQKRRLAIGIALIGNPKVIFMDEPTNGLDPIMRRQIWDIIHKIKKDRAIILSTHSMDEAQVCCQKVGIMKNGSFATIGTPFEICQAYSKRYNLTLKIDESNRQIAETFIVATLPFVKYQQQIFKNRDRFQFEASSTEIAHIFEVFKARSFTNSIISWQIGGYSLRDAFYNIHAPETDQDYETDVNDLEDMQYEL